MADSSSDEQPTVEERKESFQQLQRWFQNQSMAITNTELFTLQIFDPLQQYCEKINHLKIPELDEAKQLMDSFYKKACRIMLKIKRKSDLGKDQHLEKAPSYMRNEDEEVEKNRKILIEVKKKLYCLIRCNIPLPFIINYIRYRKLNANYKLTLMVDDSLLDCIDWYLMNNQINENLWNQPLPQESKLKGILVHLLETLEKEKEIVHEELCEIILKLKRTFLMKQIEKSSQQQQNIDKYTSNSSRILINLSKAFDQFDAKIYGQRQNYFKSYGVAILTKILLFQCHYFHILLPEILLHTKISGNLEKLKQDKERSNTIRLKGKITFLRQIYNFPQIKQWCDQNQVIPFEMIKIVPQYLQEHYYARMCRIRDDLNLNNEDYFVESQLKWVIREYQSQRNKLRQIFQDLRFQENKTYIFDLYQDWISRYNGDYDSIKNFQSARYQKDIMIACYIRHIEILVSEDTQNKQIMQIVKFDFLLAPRKNFCFQQSTYDRSWSISNKCHYLKLFIIDMIALEQPFPFIFEFLSYEDGKVTQVTKNLDLYGQFFYCPQVRVHFKQRYQYIIQVEEQQNKVVFQYIPVIHIDHLKPIASLQWSDIILRQLRLIVVNKNYLTEEIAYLSNNNKYLTLRSHIFQDRKFFSEHFQLMQEIDLFYNTQDSRKKQKGAK